MANFIEENRVSRKLPYEAVVEVREDQWRMVEPRQEKA
jgi:hypothetical protein